MFYAYSIVASAIVHLTMAVLLLGNFFSDNETEPKPAMNVVQAQLVDAPKKKKVEVVDLTLRKKLLAEIAAAKEEKQLKKVAAEKREQQRLREKRVKEKQAKELIKETARLKKEAQEREIALKRKEEERKERLKNKETRKRLDEEKRQQELQNALYQELQRQENEEEEHYISLYRQQLNSALVAAWSRPLIARRGMETILNVSLVPNGELVSVTIFKSSDNLAFDYSAIKAVQNAAPYTMIRDMPPRIFESHFRNFQFRFNPLDLRQ